MRCDPCDLAREPSSAFNDYNVPYDRYSTRHPSSSNFNVPYDRYSTRHPPSSNFNVPHNRYSPRLPSSSNFNVPYDRYSPRHPSSVSFPSIIRQQNISRTMNNRNAEMEGQSVTDILDR